MSDLQAYASGQFKIGDIEINRLGFGAMRVTGPGVWGPLHLSDADFHALDVQGMKVQRNTTPAA